jgi:hypothetical protein
MPKLVEFTQELGYYLDYQKARPARPGRKVVWADKYGNSHSLAFVIEAGGTDTVVGRPIAFIESAWRRYTKHSKNKAQEIQGAVLPIVEKHRHRAPFVGVVLAGEFTKPSLQQLRSLDFSVIHIPYQVIVTAFRAIGVELAFDESTEDVEFRRASSEIAALKRTQLDKLRAEICKQCDVDITAFMKRLHDVLRRSVVDIDVVPLWGQALVASSREKALQALACIDLTAARGKFLRFDVRVTYSNGDVVHAEADTRDEVAAFLDGLGVR